LSPHPPPSATLNLIGPSIDSERPCLVAFGGAKGGVGRSTMCAETARSLARQGARVLCVDASWTCPTLHLLLHAPEPPTHARLRTPPLGEPNADIADYIQETAVKSIWLATLAAGRRYPYVRPAIDALDIILQLQELDFDWILIDLPPGLDPFGINLFIQCDVPIHVASPDPASIRLLAQFTRATIFHAISAHPGAANVEDSLLALLYAQPLMMSRATLFDASYGPEVGAIIDDTLDALQTYLVVNMVREGSERDLGHILTYGLQELIGHFPRYMGAVDYEDRRWFYSRRALQTPGRSEDSSSNDIERLVRQLNQLDELDQRLPRPAAEDPNAHPADLLGISPDSGANHIRQHCRRLWEGCRRESTVGLIFEDPDERLRLADRIEALYRQTLSLPTDQPHLGADDASRSQELFSHTDPDPTPPHSAGPIQHSPMPAVSPPPLPSAARPRPEHSPGRLIERLRQQHNISLQELSQRTHIGLKYLAAIEDGHTDILPRSVYLRGYLREIARVFSVDAEQLIEEYFRLMA
jgi:flagellar biosynthesis protein FlhG